MIRIYSLVYHWFVQPLAIHFHLHLVPPCTLPGFPTFSNTSPSTSGICVFIPLRIQHSTHKNWLLCSLYTKHESSMEVCLYLSSVCHPRTNSNVEPFKISTSTLYIALIACINILVLIDPQHSQTSESKYFQKLLACWVLLHSVILENLARK